MTRGKQDTLPASSEKEDLRISQRCIATNFLGFVMSFLYFIFSCHIVSFVY